MTLIFLKKVTTTPSRPEYNGYLTKTHDVKQVCLQNRQLIGITYLSSTTHQVT